MTHADGTVPVPPLEPGPDVTPPTFPPPPVPEPVPGSPSPAPEPGGPRPPEPLPGPVAGFSRTEVG